MVFKLKGIVLFDIGRLIQRLRQLAGVNVTFNARSRCSLLYRSAKEQVHEEVAERRGGLQRSGGGGGLPGRTLCGVCSSAASCDAGSPNRGPCSHKVILER